MDLPFPTGLYPGFLIYAYYLSAGLVLSAAAQGAALAFAIPDRARLHIAFAFMCLLAAALQLNLTRYHLAESLPEAISYSHAQVSFSMLYLFSVLAWGLQYFNRTRLYWLLPPAGLLSIALIVAEFLLPAGIRFEPIVSVDAVTLPWDERLMVINGKSGFFGGVGRFYFIAVCLWLVIESFLVLLKGDRFTGALLMTGSLGFVVSVFLSVFVDIAELRAVYLGGFGCIGFTLVVFLDTARKWSGAMDRIEHLEYRDSHTGLPNRNLLLERLQENLAISLSVQRYLALILFDIDRFRAITSASGAGSGDFVIEAIVERVSSLLEEGATLARLSDDQFALLIPDCGPSSKGAATLALARAEQIQAAARESIVLPEGPSFVLSLSVGIAVSRLRTTETGAKLLRAADTAQQQAQDDGGNTIRFFDADMGDLAAQRFHLETELRSAIKSNELELYLQPQFTSAGQPIGAEALVRWNHPQRGLLSPATFIPLAEESDLINELSEWVFREICGTLTRQAQQGAAPKISMNVSPRHFRNEDFVAWHKTVAAEYGTDPSQIVLEVTEGLLLDDLSDTVMKMNELRDLGFRISIDDFGTGYSSLAYLKRLPIHEIKIDKMFVQDVPQDSDAAAVIEAILSIAQHLNLAVVAEGVETEEQVAFLSAKAEMLYQGYLYGRPKPVSEWLDLLGNHGGSLAVNAD